MKHCFHLAAATLLLGLPAPAVAGPASAGRPHALRAWFWKRSKPAASPAPQPTPPTPPPAAPKTPAAKTTPPRPAAQAPKIAYRKLSAEERDAQVRLQIFLDSALFSPGKVDGQLGELTTQALVRYQKAHGIEPNGKSDNLPLPSEADIYTTYTIRAEDRRFVGDAPSRPEEQSRKNYLPYGSYLELITERFHVAESLLAQLNPSLKLEALTVGDTLTVPAVKPFLIEAIQATASLPAKAEFKTRRIRVDRKEHVLELLEGEQMVASVPITVGSETLPTPAGKWRIVGICLLPTFRWDEGVLKHGVRTENFYNLPAGPNNPVGVAWCALNKPGIGIHGTNRPETIGRSISHGCMRVANWDIIRLIDLISVETAVLIE